MSPTYLRYSANSGLQKHNRFPRKKDRSGAWVFTPWCEQHVPTSWKIYLTKSQVGLYLLWGTHVYHGLLGKYPPTLIRFARAIAVHYMTAYFKYFSDSVATSVCFRLVFQVFWQILMAKKTHFLGSSKDTCSPQMGWKVMKFSEQVTYSFAKVHF